MILSRPCLALMALPLTVEARLKLGSSRVNPADAVSKAGQHRRAQEFSPTQSPSDTSSPSQIPSASFSPTRSQSPSDSLSPSQVPSASFTPTQIPSDTPPIDHITYFNTNADGSLTSTLWDAAYTASLVSQGIYFGKSISFDILGISDQLALSSNSYDVVAGGRLPAPHLAAYMQHKGVPYVLGVFRGREVSTFDFADFMNQAWVIAVCAVTGIIGCGATVLIAGVWLEVEKVERQVKRLCRKIRKSDFNYALNTSIATGTPGSYCLMSNELMEGFEEYDDFSEIKLWLEYCKGENGGPCQLVLSGHSNGGVYAHAAALSLKPYLDEYYSEIYNSTSTTFHPYVFMFGSPPSFSLDTNRNSECSYLDNEKAFNFMNLSPKTNVYDLSIQMALERGASHLGNHVILNTDVDDKVKRYWPGDDSFDVGSAECDIDVRRDRSLSKLLSHLADEYSSRLMKLSLSANFTDVGEGGFSFGDGCKRDAECQPGLYCRDSDKTCWHANTLDVGERCKSDIQCKQLADSNAVVSCWKREGDSAQKCWPDSEKLERGVECGEDEQCLDGSICYKAPDANKKKCWPEHFALEGDRCSRSIECNETLACFKEYDESDSSFDSHERCWPRADLQQKGELCTTDSQCAGSMTCWSAYEYSDDKTRCFDEADRLGEQDACSKDHHCGAGLECKRKYDENYKSCWLMAGGWLSQNDACEADVECKYDLVCAFGKCDDAEAKFGEKIACDKTSECQPGLACFKGFNNNTLNRDDEKKCHTSYQTREERCEDNDHCEIGLACFEHYGNATKFCWAESDKHGKGGDCERDIQCAYGFECKKKPGASDKRCWDEGDNWLDNDDRCWNDDQCPNNNVCVRRYNGYDHKQCSSQAQLQDETDDCENDSQCASGYECKKKPGANTKHCWGDGDNWLMNNDRCRNDDQCPNNNVCVRRYDADYEQCTEQMQLQSTNSTCENANQCQARLICEKDEDVDPDDKVCMVGNLRGGAKCKYDFQCQNSTHWQCFKRFGNSNKRCYDSTYKQGHEQRCDTDRQCGLHNNEQLECWRNWDDDGKSRNSNNRCWASADKQDEHDKCEEDDDCQGDLVCRNKPGTRKYCVISNEVAWLQHGDQCDNTDECQGTNTCFNVRGDGSTVKKCLGYADKQGDGEDCNYDVQCKNNLCFHVPGDGRKCRTALLDLEEECSEDRSCGSHNNTGVVEALVCKAKVGTSQKKCYYDNWPWLNNDDGCDWDGECPVGDTCYKRWGDSYAKCTNNSNLQGHEKRCGVQDDCKSHLRCRQKKGSSKKKCWKNDDLVARGGECKHDGECMEASSGVPMEASSGVPMVCGLFQGQNIRRCWLKREVPKRDRTDECVLENDCKSGLRCRQRNGESQKKCWYITDLGQKGEECDNNDQCSETDDGVPMICRRKADQSDSKCWPEEEILIGHETRCEQDSDCDGSLLCRQRRGWDEKRCWYNEDLVVRGGDCEHSGECMEGSSDVPMVCGWYPGQSRRACWHETEVDKRGRTGECFEAYDCQSHLYCRQRKGWSKKRCWENNDLQDLDKDCGKDEHCRDSLACRKKLGTSQSKCYQAVDPWLDNSDRCDYDGECPSGDTCYQCWGDSNKKCTNNSNLQGHENRCDVQDDCRSHLRCRQRKGSSKKKCWNNNDLLAEGQECDNDGQCSEGSNSVPMVCGRKRGQNRERCWPPDVDFI